MAKIDTKWDSVKKTPKKVVATEPKSDTPDLNSILERLERVERENKELKEGKENTFKKAREINDDPKRFSYKTWGGVPVLDFKSKKKDETRDLVYKNKFGQYESNHILVLKLADGSECEVEVTEFGKSFDKSEKLVAKDHHNEFILNRTLPLAKSFTFEDTEHGTFTVMPSCIN